jgi:hypothetical protein
MRMARLEIIVGGTADTTGRRGRALRAEERNGGVVRLAPGRFVDADAWRAANAGERHIARIKALHDRLASRLVVSHASAAALHGLPWPGEFPEVIDVLDPERATSQNLRGVHKRAAAGRSIATRTMTATGRQLTDLVVTGVDLAITQPLRTSVPALDVVLARGVTRSALETELAERGPVHGRHRAERAIELADGRSGSPGESVARVALDEVGAPVPVLQQRFDDGQGHIGTVDFWFPEQRAVLEFDGRVKYSDPSMRRAGQTAADVVVAEKRREDRLRRHTAVDAVGRIGFAETNDTEALRAVLRAIGVPSRVRRFTRLR